MQVLQEPAFVRMLEEMTVNRTQTSRARRQLTSVEDQRLVARASGGVAAAIIAAVVSVFVVIDTCNLIRHLKRMVTVRPV